MDFIIGLAPYKGNSSEYDFDSVLVVVDRYSKIARYIPYYKIIDSLELVELL